MIRYLWPRNSKARLLGGIGGFFCSAPQDFWCWVSFARAFLLGRRVITYGDGWRMTRGRGQNGASGRCWVVFVLLYIFKNFMPHALLENQGAKIVTAGDRIFYLKRTRTQ